MSVTRLVMVVWLAGAVVLACVVLASVMSGCALVPNYVEPEIEHTSP